MNLVKVRLKKLFSYTQTALAKRVVACLVFPVVLHQLTEKSHDVFKATFNLVHIMGFWQSLPYVVVCALVIAITRWAVIIGHRLRSAYKLV
ncbi:hypothetical protein [Pseudomonas sp. NPDC089569]|uniref:hypothetical protein n=1 Tax=Pseudomonas sp. NPDC089569 TaxID=3390722 RepID=UPI003D039438